MKPQKIKNLFLRQSCQDAWQEYEKSLTKKYFIQWDYVILTASNEEQAAAYRAQIDARLAAGRLPAGTVYEVLPDPDGKRVGSGGATFHVMKYLSEQGGRRAFLPGETDPGDPFGRRFQAGAPVFGLRQAVLPGAKRAAGRAALHAVR